MASPDGQGFFSALYHVIRNGPIKLNAGEDNFDIMSIVLMATLICICIIIGHLLEENRWLNESVIAVALGLLTGSVILFIRKGESRSSHLFRFNEELFFIYMLPPIIFNAGFQVKKKHFFRNFVPIILYGVVGTIIAFAVISLGCWLIFPRFGFEELRIKDYLALGIIFSPSDTVCVLQVLSQEETPLLYSLVFGEGVVNDATAVVVFRAITKFSFSDSAGLSVVVIVWNFFYLFFASTALGALVGLLSAYIIKSLYFGRKLVMGLLAASGRDVVARTVSDYRQIADDANDPSLAPCDRHSTDREIAIMVLMAYLSYVIAELVELSGIVTVFFCGIVMSHYTWHNVTEGSRTTTKHMFATLSFIAETFIFLYVGMDALDVEKWDVTDPVQALGVFFTLLLLTPLGRAAAIFPLSFVANFTRSESDKIDFRRQVVIWWAGLMRGAVSIALAFNQFTASGSTKNPEHGTLIVSTMAVVLFTTLCFGIITKPLIEWIIPYHSSERPFGEISEPNSPKTPMLIWEGTPRTPLLRDGDNRGPVRVTARKVFFERFNRNITGAQRSFDLILNGPPRTVHALWRAFDDNYMRPIFGGRGFTPFTPGMDIDERGLAPEAQPAEHT